MPARPLVLSHPVRVEALKLRGTRITVAAREDELQAIATELGLASLETLQARYELVRNGETVKLEGVIAARMHQTCIVTLDAFAVEIDVPVRLDFAPEQPSRPASRRAEAAETGPVDIEVNLNEDDPPEPIVDGVIDLGAVTLEFLALSLDPYPRKPGAGFDAAPVETAAESPFAALARLKRES
jgi:uncharacterized metal-binding protein YceD (DUF177 family)